MIKVENTKQYDSVNSLVELLNALKIAQAAVANFSDDFTYYYGDEYEECDDCGKRGEQCHYNAECFPWDYDKDYWDDEDDEEEEEEEAV